MVNIFLSLILVLFTFQGFILTYQLGGLNKTIYNIPKSLFENAIVLVQNETTEDVILYFNGPNLEYYVTSYLNDNLHDYSLEYDVSFNYYESKSKTMCRSDKCDGVRVIFQTKIMNLYDYRKTISYEVRKNNE